MKFKTSINCGGCVAAVSPVLNNISEIKQWHVDTENPGKILTVEAEDSLTPQEIIDKLSKVGHKAQLVG